jgi:DNA-binding transcriptional LysR family regulator
MIMPRKKSSPKGIVESAAVDPISIGWALIIAEQRSFRGAARKLGIRHASVSRRLRELEDSLGVSLFERSHSGLKLTNAGTGFFQEAREAFQQLQRATKMAAEAGQGSTGRLRIGIQPSMGAGFLRELLQAYAERHPRVTIEIVEGAPAAKHVSRVKKGRLDVAFVADTADAADCEIVPLWSERLFVVLPQGHRLGERTAVDWGALRNERFIIRQAKCDPALCERVIKHLGDPARKLVIQKLSVGRETLMHLVAMGRGLTITSEASVATSYPKVIFRPISGGDDTVQFSAVWSAGNDNPARRRFLSLARTRAKQRDGTSHLKAIHRDQI